MPIHRKTRSESRMQRLAPPQQDRGGGGDKRRLAGGRAAYNFCRTASLKEALPWLKSQFNITIGKSALSTWLQEQRIERSMAAELAALRDNQQAAHLISNVAQASAPLTIANSLLFASAVFNEFRKPEAQRDETRLARYMDLALKARDLEIRASAVQVSFERMRLDSAKKTPHALPDPESIPNEREKTEQAMVLLFGDPPIAFKSQSDLPVTEMNPAWQTSGPATHAPAFT
jgi:hypothetical protein